MNTSKQILSQYCVEQRATLRKKNKEKLTVSIEKPSNESDLIFDSTDED